MKGSPMQRNFGVSPVKQFSGSKKQDPIGDLTREQAEIQGRIDEWIKASEAPQQSSGIEKVSTQQISGLGKKIKEGKGNPSGSSTTMKMKSPIKDQESNKGNKHPHTTPVTSARGIHTDKHGNKTGSPK